MKKAIKCTLVLLLAISMIVSLTPLDVMAEQDNSGENSENITVNEETVAPADVQEDETAKSDEGSIETEEGIDPLAEEDETIFFEQEFKDYKVIVTAGETAFPAGTVMKAEKVDLDETRDQMIDELGKIIIPSAAVDISFFAGGEEVYPSSDVQVRFEADFIEKDKEAIVVHIDDEGKCEEKEIAEQEDSALTIETDEFSVYAVAYTVDFMFEGLSYSIDGETSVKLSTILEKLDTGLEISYIADAIFSDETLVKVEKDSGEETDWTLTSLAPFTTEETLTLTLRDDSTVEIKVTDELTEAVTGTCGTVTWTIDTDGNMVLKPTSGASGKLADSTSSARPSWNTYNSDIKTIRFEGSVIANTNSYYLFADMPNLVSFNAEGFDMSQAAGISGMFQNDSSLETLDLSGMDTSNVVYAQGVFSECSSLKSLNVSDWNTSKTTRTDGMFMGCSSLESLDISNWDMSKNTSMDSMFSRCEALTSLDLSDWNTSKVTNMRTLFYQCHALSDLDVSGLDTGSVTNMQYMFYECSSLSSVDVSGFDTGSVTDMGHMFAGCSSLTTVDVSGFNTSNVKYMDYMFAYCEKLQQVDVSSFNTSSAKTFKGMFRECRGLSEVDVTGFVTTNVVRTSYMFEKCSSLTSVDLSGWDTSNVQEMEHMFNGCRAITEIKTGEKFKTPKVTNMTQMFMDCNSLEELDLSMMAQNGALEKARNMFCECSSLKKLDIKGMDVRNVAVFGDFFHDCNSVDEITIGEGFCFPHAGEGNYLDTGFLRGTWKRDADGQIYSSTELVQLLDAGPMPGTYTRVTEHSISVDFPATYAVHKVTDWELISESDKFVVDGDRVWMKVDLNNIDETDPYTMDESFTLLFKNNVEDAEGNTYNLKLDFNNIRLYRHDFIHEYEGLGDVYYHMFFRLTDDGVICIRGEDRLSSDLNKDNDIAYSTVFETNAWQDITVTIVDDEGNPQEGSYIFSIYDLDIPSSLDEGGGHSEYESRGYGLNSEGVYLKDGFDTDTVTKADYTYLTDVGNTANGYRVHGSQVDGSSESTDLIVKGNAAGSTFTWTGQSCENFLFFQYQPKPVHIDKVDQYGNRIDGAELALYKIEKGEGGVETETFLQKWESNSERNHDFSSFLPPGKYIVKETVVPGDYEKAEDVTFIVDVDFDVCDENGNKLDNANIVSVTDKLKKGSLKITKDLTEHENVVFGDRIDETTFIFHVKVTYGNKTFYDDIVTMVFNEAESQTVTIDDLPAGATAVVEEIYAGGNYVAESSIREVRIKAPKQDEDPAEAKFLNSHNGDWKGGGSVENKYEKDGNGGWTVSNKYSKED